MSLVIELSKSFATVVKFLDKIYSLRPQPLCGHTMQKPHREEKKGDRNQLEAISICSIWPWNWKEIPPWWFLSLLNHNKLNMIFFLQALFSLVIDFINFSYHFAALTTCLLLLPQFFSLFFSSSSRSLPSPYTPTAPPSSSKRNNVHLSIQKEEAFICFQRFLRWVLDIRFIIQHHNTRWM